MRFKFQAVHSAHAQIECAHVRTSTAARVEDLYITLLQIRVEDMQDIIETQFQEPRRLHQALQ